MFKQLNIYNDRHNQGTIVEDELEDVKSIQNALKSSFANIHTVYTQLSLIDFSMTNLLKS